MNRTLPVALTAALLLALPAPPLLLAQDATATPDYGHTYYVTAISSGFDEDRDLFVEGMDTFAKALEARGFRKAEHPYWTFAIAVQPLVQDENLVVLSVVATAALPERVVEWASEAQVFYAGVDLTNLPAEGRFIREYVSEDYIRQYGMLQDHEVVVVHRSDLVGGAGSIVDRFIARHIKR